MAGWGLHRSPAAILHLTQEYLALFFDYQVKVNRQIALAAIPERAVRTHPAWGDPQLLTGYILHDVLEPDRPADALAYLALTASDLSPGRGWNFVFGEADLRERTGVWSIYRNGDPESDFLLCLRRTPGTASHETGHILGMWHFAAYSCLMNGSNHQQEKDRRLSNQPCIQQWQTRLTTLQQRLAGGCRLDLDLEALVRSGAFSEAKVERFLLERTPRIVGSMYRGVAVK